MQLRIQAVNYQNADDSQALIQLMHHYAMDAAGGGQALSDAVYNLLPQRLGQISSAFSFLAFQQSHAVGLVNCFEGFSTFACRPLINIHDLVVHYDYRGHGIGQALLQAVEAEAIARGCCKITLEVLENNRPARKAYRKFGFQGYELDPAMGQAIFLEKKLGPQEA